MDAPLAIHNESGIRSVKLVGHQAQGSRGTDSRVMSHDLLQHHWMGVGSQGHLGGQDVRVTCSSSLPSPAFASESSKHIRDRLTLVFVRGNVPALTILIDLDVCLNFV